MGARRLGIRLAVPDAWVRGSKGSRGASKVKRLALLTLSWGPYILNSILGCPGPSCSL